MPLKSYGFIDYIYQVNIVKSTSFQEENFLGGGSLTSNVFVSDQTKNFAVHTEDFPNASHTFLSLGVFNFLGEYNLITHVMIVF